MSSLPGNFKYFINITRILSILDLIVLVVSGASDDFERQKWDTEIYIQLAKTLSSATEIIIVVSKMDLVENKSTRFSEIKQSITEMVNPHFKIRGIIPSDITGSSKDFVGDFRSIFEKLINEPGPTKYSELNLSKLPFCFPIFRGYRIKGVGTVAIGKALSGGIIPGSKLTYLGKKPVTFTTPSIVFSIERHHHSLSSGEVDNFIGINLKNCNYKDIERGNIILCNEKETDAVKEIFVESVAIVASATVIGNNNSLTIKKRKLFNALQHDTTDSM